MATARKRRGYLKYVAGAVLGLGGYGVGTGTLALPESTDTILGPPATENPIKTVTHDHPVFQQLTLYESGAGEVEFQMSNDADYWGVAHSSQDVEEEAAKTWSIPDGMGSVTVDLKTAIRSHDAYPRNSFKLGVADKHYRVMAREFSFSVPETWLP